MTDEVKNEDVAIEIPQDDTVGAVVVDTGADKDTVVKAADQPDKTKNAEPGGGDGEKIVEGAAASDEFKKQLEETQRRADEQTREWQERARKAEAERDGARQEALRFQSEHEKANYEVVVNAIEATTKELDFAKAQFREAFAKGDADKAADAQEKIARAGGRLSQLEGGKHAMEEALEARKNAKPQARTQEADDPTEAYISRMSPRTQRWLNSHREYVTDQKKNLRLVAAHNEALADDHVPDSDAYFDAIERKLGLKAAADTGADKPNEATQRTRTAMPAAPVSRDPVNGGGHRQSQVVLTPGEQRAATDGTLVWGKHDFAAGRIKNESLVGQPIGLKEMAIRKAAMSKDGMYDLSMTQ